jgi:hypothetical protein
MKRKRITKFVQIIEPNSSIPLINTVDYDGAFCKCGAMLIFDKDEEYGSYIMQCPFCGFEIRYN